MSSGGVVFRKCGAEAEILLILDRFGLWALPKGHQEPEETLEETALREIKEETGISGIIVDRLETTEYQFTSEDEAVIKTVHFFLVEAQGIMSSADELVLNPAEVSQARWVSLETAVEAIGYANLAPVVEAAADRLQTI